MNLFNYLKKIDWIIVFAILGLATFGIISIHSSSLISQNFTDFYKQIGFLGLSLIVMIFVSFIDYRKIRENTFLIVLLYLVSVFLLVGVLFVPAIRDTATWYKIGPFSFDPIEPMKIALILILAKFFSKRHREIYNLKNVIISLIYIVIPCVLVFLQPNFGPIVIFLCIWFGVLLVSGIRKKHLAILFMTFGILFAFSFAFIMEDYQKDRIINFISSENDELGDDWNKNQSQIAIGSGGFLGKGIGNGSQAQYGFLPEPKTDFIFAAIGEETGFVGLSIISLLYILFFYRVLKVSINSRSNFARLFLAGWSISIFAQMLINMSMNLGLLPVVGLPLPFVSYGGSNLLFNFICLGVMQNIKIVET
ncbi:MAG: FtsW/RodA/SpoVE family cell cycle protein [Candidatus Pacebacteria bacterium]|nr:FtsW/RodA/SpoVE family cell cycle protein [Candidatus Paceibacterota bacterium]MDD3919222.1 FtsW/RodA/SpoVE family cell cycle protein [Candidatus Paceibacterota bacterium]